MADFCLNCMKQHDADVLDNKDVIESLSPDLCESCGTMKPVVIHIIEKKDGMTLIERLDKARAEIEKAYNANDSRKMAELAIRIKGLYSECNNIDEDTKVYHYAQYLKLMIQLHFVQLFDGNGGDSDGLFDLCGSESFKAGLINVSHN